MHINSLLSANDGTLSQHENAAPRTSIKRLIRRMRGKSQAVLALGEDNAYYVVKSEGHISRRALVNECVGHVIQRALSITTPELRHILVERGADLYGTATDVGHLNPGLHLGSRVPANPNDVAVFDFLPFPFAERMVNSGEVAPAVAADIWLSHNDSRQAIYRREGSGFRAYFIDNDQLLSGNAWSVECNRAIDTREIRSRLLRIPNAHDLMDAVERIWSLDLHAVIESAFVLADPWLRGTERVSFERVMLEADRKRHRLAALIREFPFQTAP